VSAGVSNALNASEKSPTLFTGSPVPQWGTVNTVIITNARLLDDCLVSAVITATEAKTASLFDLGVKSVVTGAQATGTGTDSVTVVSGHGTEIQYAGGHTLFGQLIGEAVYTGVKRSLSRTAPGNWDLDKIRSRFNF
ncbi:MAG: adenosylcobinamide amidohydrolase, partial [Spirochaetota bacterium]